MNWLVGLLLLSGVLPGSTVVAHYIGQSNATHRDLRASSSQPLQFRPLQCNIPECNKGSTTWKALNYDVAQTKVVIPCGLCVDMDYNKDVLYLPHGLEVHGSLRFPNGYHLSIETPFIIVQGLLTMVSVRKVTGTPSVNVKLTGTREVSFVPVNSNRGLCDDDKSVCQVGTKPVVVAGGKVDLRGIAPSCKTWVNLIDVSSVTETFPLDYARATTLDPNHENVICREHDAYVSPTRSFRAQWTAGYGALYSWKGGYLSVSGRKDSLEHAATLDMLPFQDCLIPGETYLFSARVRLRHTRLAVGTPTKCNENGENCISLQYIADFPARRIGSRKGREFPSDDFRYGRWEDFYATFTFNDNEMAENTVYQLLRINGPSPAADIELDVDDVTFGLVPPSFFPDPADVCGGNLIANGNAEASSIHPYPMRSPNGRLEVVTFSSGNRVFRLSGRNSDMDSVQTDLMSPQCIVTGAQYTVRSRVRFVSNTPVKSRMIVRIIFRASPSIFIHAASCPDTGKSWKNCNGKFTVLEDFDPRTVESVRIYFVTEGSPSVDMDVDDWEVSLSRAAKSSIIVQSNGVKGCWGKGVELALTSHSLDRNDAQVRKVISEPVELGNGRVRLDLDESIIFPVTRAQDQDFATEVLLLSRNIQFSSSNEEANRGGHFMVLQTPGSANRQMIRGVAFRSFGRLGQLGRYPIHFHLCDSTASTVEQNLIIDSHQRCVVLHGTHNTTVRDNVAFRTKGHCFMLEDGGEMDNRFEYNVGALTSAATRIVRNGETDNTNPSTFWISNPHNHFIGNVGAGSEGNGFWFELQTGVKPPTLYFPWARDLNPKFLPLLTFHSNVAHSNYRAGFRTYPHGFIPPGVALFDNIRSYKNRQDGLFMRNTENLHVTGGVFADNRDAISMELSQNIVVDGASIIGRTDRFAEIVESENSLTHDDRLVGINLHVATEDTLEFGAAIRNVQFTAFDGSASNTSLFDVTIERTRDWNQIFSFWTTFENTFTDDVSMTRPFDFRKTSAAQHAAVYLVDRDSNLKPPGTTTTSSSVVIADVDDIKAFCDLKNRCHRSEEFRYWYCLDTCLRTVIFSIDPTFSNGVELEIVDQQDPSRSFCYKGRFPTPSSSDGIQDWDKYISFGAALPRGSYVARFRRRDSAVVWPSFVETTWGPELCDDGAGPDDIRLVAPAVSASRCFELIRNGNMENGSSSPWLHSFDGGLAIEPGAGRQGSNALGDLNQSNSMSGMGQYIDTRCVTVGAVYEVRVWVRLERPNGTNMQCNTADCGPKLKMRTMTANPSKGPSVPLEREIHPLARRFSGTLQPDWNLLYARITMDTVWEQASSIFLFVDRGRTGPRLFIDDFSMRRVN